MTGSSLWELTAPEIPAGTGRPPSRTGVVIAGAGLTGLALACMLAADGVECTVLEARRVGAGTTGHTTGKLSLLQGKVYARVRDHAGDDVVRAYAQAQRAGQSWLRRAMAAAPEAMRPASAISYAMTEDGVIALEHEFAALEVAGVASRVVDEDEEIDGLPFAPRSALVLEEQTQLHAWRVLAELVRQLRSAGVPLVEGCRVTGADVEGDGVRVATSQGEMVADRLVLATGTPVLDRGLDFAKLQPSRSFAAAYRVPDGTVLPEGMLLSVDEPSRSLRLAESADRERLLVVGGGAHVPGRAGSTRALLDELDEWTRGNWPEARRELWWAAQDYRSVTGAPLVGELPRSRGRVLAATGYDKWGMANAVAAAMRLAGELRGVAPGWADALHGQGLSWPTAAETVRDNAQVGARLVSGWVRAETSGAEPRPGEGEGRVVAEGGRPIAESTVDGVACRVSAVCSHLGGIVAWNDVERSWDCPLHGSRFRPDGVLIEGPAVEDLDSVAEQSP